jgi:hypothetical protein
MDELFAFLDETVPYIGLGVYLCLMFFFGRTNMRLWAVAVTVPPLFGLAVWSTRLELATSSADPLYISHFHLFAVGQVILGAASFAFGMMLRRKSPLS